MSNRDPDARYERPEQAIPWMIEQWVRMHLHTGAFGRIVEYDPRTKRARVQPVIRAMYADAAGATFTADKPPILNVPVRQVATGGHLVHHQIDRNDVVWMSYSERGLEHFKAQWGELVDPPVDAFFDERDAVAVPWGVESIVPVRSTGWLVQNASGTAYVSVDGDTIRLVSGGTSIELDGSGIRAAGSSLTHNGVNVGSDHTHSGVTAGPSRTGGPG